MLRRICITLCSFLLCAPLAQTGSSQVLGDRDGDGRVGLAEALFALQVTAGMRPQPEVLADRDGDGRVGLAEALYALQVTAGMTPPNTHTNTLGMTFNLIPGGTFMMGSPLDELGRYSVERQHQVTISTSYYMQTTEVTQAQWEAVMASNPSYFSGCADCPVEVVSWHDAQAFISALNAMGQGSYRLPTEAEWEYASRAGSDTAFANGDITEILCLHDPNLNVMGWYCYNSGNRTHPVAQKDPNAWGLYDMHGNVWEWCQDWVGPYPSEPVTDPTGPSSGENKVIRGGAFDDQARHCRSAILYRDGPNTRLLRIGFRLVKIP